jgi:hypothetical protein
VIAAFAPSARIDATLGLILGTEKPIQSMADGAALKRMMTKHGFLPYWLGYVDSKLLTAQLPAIWFGASNPQCRAELAAVSARVPRAVMGYTELSAKRVSAATIVEMASDLVAQLKGVKTSIAGLDTAMAGDPLFAMGGGINIDRGRELGKAFAGVLGRVGRACSEHKLEEAAHKLEAAMAKPLPIPINGFGFAIHDIVMKPGDTFPESLQGLALVSGPSGKAVLDGFIQALPLIANLGIIADGKLHVIDKGMTGMVPYEIWVGVGNHSLLVSIGDKERKLAESVLSARTHGETPLFAMAYDYGRLMSLMEKFPDDAEDEDADGSRDPRAKATSTAADKAVLASVSKLIGRADMVLDVEDHGLGMWFAMDMK